MQNTDFIETLSAKLSDGVQPAMDLVVENILNESDFAKYGNDEEDVYYKYSILLRASGFRPNEFENELRASVSAASDIAVTSNSKKGKALDRESLLCEVIEYLAKEYYNGHEKASDDSYDGLVMELRSINPKNPLAAGGLAAADDTGRKKFQGTFVGFFPAENPKYTILVTVYSYPSHRNFYGGTMPALAVREIVDKLYALDGEWDQAIKPTAAVPVMEKGAVTEKGLVPDLKGFGLKDALYTLESIGLNCQYSGVGHVSAQSPAPGSKYEKGQTVKITLK